MARSTKRPPGRTIAKRLAKNLKKTGSPLGGAQGPLGGMAKNFGTSISRAAKSGALKQASGRPGKFVSAAAKKRNALRKRGR